MEENGYPIGSGVVESTCKHVVPVECNVNIGATGPVKVWVDGQEMLSSETYVAWWPNEYTFPISFDLEPRRFVIKCLRLVDDYRFSMCFLKRNVAGDKTRGVSYLIDSLGDLI